MPIVTNKEENKDLTVFTVTGVLSHEEVMPVVKSFYEGEPTKHVLWDLINTTEVHLTSAEVEKIATYRMRYEGKRASGKTAIVAQKDVLFGISRMFEMQSKMRKAPYLIMVFRNMDDAYKWLEAS